MARSRNIKPAFFNNDELAEIDPLGRLFFIGLWTIADYQGSFIWREKRLKAMILPYDNCDVKQFAINLDKSGFIQFYTDGVEMYAKIVNFEVHQNPHKNERAKGSDIPEFNKSSRQVIDFKGLTIKSDKIAINPDQYDTDRADSLNLIPDTFNPITDPLSDKSPTATPIKIVSCQIDEVVDGYNETIKQLKPNWSSCVKSTLNDKRKKLIREAIKTVEGRAKELEENPVSYLIRLFEGMAVDDFLSGNQKSAQYPNGYKRGFDLNLKPDTLIKTIDQFSE